MNNYQFRTNWCNQLVLQCKKVVRRSHFGEPIYAYKDATTEDLKQYYHQLHKLQEVCVYQQQRELFESECE